MVLDMLDTGPGRLISPYPTQNMDLELPLHCIRSSAITITIAIAIKYKQQHQ